MGDLKQLHVDLCHELGIEPAEVKIMGMNMIHLGGYFSKEKCIEIYVCWYYDMRLTVAHETYHHYQASKGWLDGIAYRGKVHKGPNSTDPCERAANRYMHKIAKREGWYETKSKQKA